MRFTLLTAGATLLAIVVMISSGTTTERLAVLDSLREAVADDSVRVLAETLLEDEEWRRKASPADLAHLFLIQSDGFYKDRQFNAATVAADSALEVVSRVRATPEFMARIQEARGKPLRRLRQFDIAQTAFQAAIAGYREAFGESAEEVARAYNFLAITYRQQGQLDSAIIAAREAIRISEKLDGDQVKRTANYCNTLARSFQMQGRIEDAARTYHRALNLAGQALGEDNPRLNGFHNNLGNAYNDMGRFETALQHYRTALQMRETLYGPEHMRVAQTLSNIALVHYNVGDYPAAESGYRRALAIFRSELGDVHEYVGGMTMNLGALYLDQRRYADAERVLREGKGIFEALEPNGHPRLAGILTNLAIVCRNTDRPDAARQYLETALDLKRAQYGSDSPAIASTLNSLGVLAFVQGRDTAAADYLSQSLAIERAAFGETHPDVATALLNLGELRSYQGEYEAADTLIAQARDIYETVYGPSNRWVADAYERAAMNHRREGDMETAWAFLQGAHRLRLTLFTENARVLSEPDALAYSTFLRHTTNLLLSVWRDLPSKPARDSVAARVVLATKGKVWDELVRRATAWQQVEDSAVDALTAQIRSTRWHLARAYVGGPGKDHEMYRMYLDSLDRRIEEYEAQLAERSVAYRQQQASVFPPISVIADQLEPADVLLDYYRFTYYPPEMKTGTDRYLAVELGRSSLSVVSLGLAADIDEAVVAYREHLQSVAALGAPLPGDEMAYREVARELTERILPFTLRDDQSDHSLILAPDGALCLIAWAGLPVTENEYLIEVADLSYLFSGRDLLREPNSGATKSGLLAVGDASFESENKPAAEFALTRSPVPQRGDLAPLPGTREEIEAIAAAWREHATEPVVTFFGKEATETRFTELASNFRVLHIATHGFYTAATDGVESYSLTDFTQPRSTVESPLLRAGLFFAQPAAGDSIAKPDDGVLTAMEVSALPLGTTELVVLSACETGLGAIVEGEGVAGLRRAFHLAGAETVVSALWPVADDRTAQLMGAIYGQADGTLVDRMLAHQRAQLRTLREANESDHPFFWAPFVAIARR